MEHLAYDQFFKVKEFQKNMEHHFNNLFVHGRYFILNKSLVHTLGKIKLKFRIIKNWHGMVSKCIS